MALPAALPLPAAPPALATGPVFVERAAELGLDFVHFNGMTGRLYYVENMGAGAALFDYDGDGDLDAYLVQGAMLEPGKSLDEAIFPPLPAMRPLSDRLYRNDLQRLPDGRTEPRFVDVTASAGIAGESYGMAVATGDYDGDGWIDLFVGNFGADRLYRNQGDGTFREVTAQAGVSDPDWSAAATFFDFDGDGRLDLYVANYLDFTVAGHKPCFGPTSAPDYCGPLSYAQQTDRLYRNRGDGSFADVTQAAGIATQTGAGLGVVASDFDGDGRDDLFVANDGGPNFLWRNRGDGTFEEMGLLSGVALNERGQAEACMGIAIGDVDGDLDEDLLVTNRSGETNTLYLAEGSGLFRDATLASGLGSPSLPVTGFGAQWLDYDNDGRLDLFVVNGEIERIEAQVRQGSRYPLAQRAQLYRQVAPGRFAETSAEGGPIFAQLAVGRGAAFGDIDNDGDTDVLVENNSGPAWLLLDQVGSQAAWLGVQALAASGGDAFGSWAIVQPPAAPTQGRRVRTDGSYSSASDPRLLFGLGAATAPASVELRAPDGSRRRFPGLATGLYYRLGLAPPPRPAAPRPVAP